MLAAFQATGETRFLQRAEELAWNITQRQAGRANGMIWEHYRSDWSVDWDFNLHDKANLFRPWGYQPGHFTEWAKLLLLLEQHGAQLQRGTDWLLPAAQKLFKLAITYAWDKQHGGIHYGFAPDGTVCDADKYFWVQAETLAAAAMLAARSGDTQYRKLYEELWQYSWTHFVDHQHGAWYRILTADNRKYSDEKSPAGKVDYHTMGACYDILRTLN
jgi:mannose/cellobiose epimerase-like protein (N-acyl-D-glucosamine 2-epimerase family)